MAQTDAKRDKATREFVEVALDEAYKIREELYGNEEDGTPGVFGRRKANREQLRSLAEQGFLSEDQRGELDELYPPRKVKDQEAEESTAAAAA